MINVTKSFLPELTEYEFYLKKIWQNGWLTNNGELVVELEKQLKEKLDVPDLWYCNNGTIVLQFAIRALELQGEIITTPFSYVATTSSILWEGCTPVFADIDPLTLTIDPEKIESLITSQTSAIIATHVYGNPCDTEAIGRIASKYNLKVIYDAAHAFAVRYKNIAIGNFGDVSTFSFHATKLFHTVEGGAAVTKDSTLSRIIYLMRQFGHYGDEHFSLGINGKVSEFHAAMGLCLLPKIDEIIEERKKISLYYDELLDAKTIKKPVIREGTEYNYAYYPILLKDEKTLERTTQALKEIDVIPRRYFYPSLNLLPYLKRRDKCPVSEDVSIRVMSLPLFFGLEKADMQKIAGVILKTAG